MNLCLFFNEFCFFMIWVGYGSDLGRIWVRFGFRINPKPIGYGYGFHFVVHMGMGLDMGLGFEIWVWIWYW
jgi:hypothetical protein